MTDTDGHTTQYFVDGQGRLNQTDYWIGSSVNWLITYATWDAYNNLVSVVDAANNETDYAYDAYGNVTAVAAPASGGALRPTQTVSYDQHYNVTAACDPNYNASHNSTWTATPSPSDSLCPAGLGTTHYTYTYTDTTNQPFGKLTDTYTPTGYHYQVTYDSNGYGLPVQIQGDPISDDHGRVPTTNFGYNSYGLVTSYGNGSGTATFTYDNLNRRSTATDPDNHTSYTYYNADGTVYKTETPYQHATSWGDTASYDQDGDLVQTSVYRMTTATSTPAPDTTNRWYDGDDRLVEMQQAADPKSDLYVNPWTTRYLYDLSQNNTSGSPPAFNGMNSYSAHGNLFKTQELLPPNNPLSVTSPAPRSVANTAFLDLNGNAFDALDRPTARYSLISQTGSGSESLVKQTLTYDASTYFSGDFTGKLTEACNSASPQQCSWYSYDAVGDTTQMHFNDSSSPDRSATYDADGNLTSLTSLVFGTESYQYDAEGRELTKQEATGGGVTSPAKFTHKYYADGTLKQLDVASGGLTQTALFAYSYRPDGRIQSLAVTYAAQANVGTTTDAFTYTSAGRPTQRSETGTGAYSSPSSWQYDSYGRLTQINFPACNNCIVPTPTNPQLTSFTWDPQGQLMATASQTFSYTVRGEALSSQTLMANGVSVPTQSAAALDTQAGIYIGGGNYDSAGRLLGGALPGAPTIAYDSENHTVSASTTIGAVTSSIPPVVAQTFGALGIYQWGPSGEPVRIGSAIGTSHTIPSASSVTYDTLHWDGGQLIFTTNPSGHVDDIKIGGSGDITPLDPSFAGITFYDRGPDGSIMGCHNVTGGSLSLTLEPYPGLPTSASVAACPGGTFGAANGPQFSWPSSILWDPLLQPSNSPINPYPYLAIGIGQGKILGMPRTDGFVDGFNMIQGARMYDATLNQWTTPDAFPGSIDDPVSQKSYLWNDGNPIAHQDPSGFCANTAVKDDGGEILATGTSTCIPLGQPGELSDILLTPPHINIYSPPRIELLPVIASVKAWLKPKFPFHCDNTDSLPQPSRYSYQEEAVYAHSHWRDYGAMAQAILWGGKFDFQRPEGQPFGPVNPDQIPEANIGVGVYMQSAGFSKSEMMQLGNAILAYDNWKGMSKADQDADRHNWHFGFGFSAANCY